MAPTCSCFTHTKKKTKQKTLNKNKLQDFAIDKIRSITYCLAVSFSWRKKNNLQPRRMWLPLWYISMNNQNQQFRCISRCPCHTDAIKVNDTICSIVLISYNTIIYAWYSLTLYITMSVHLYTVINSWPNNLELATQEPSKFDPVWLNFVF